MRFRAAGISRSEKAAGSLPRRRSSRLRVVAAISAWVLTLGTAAATTVVFAPQAAGAATAESCGFASPGTGTYASTLCWFDMSSYDATQAAAGQQFAVSIPGGYTLSFTITSSGGPIAAHAFPTYGGAYLGNNGHYTGVPGKPALYQTQSGATTTSSLTNITLTDKSGNSLTGFALVGADAESTDASESLSWHASSPISSLNPVGTACGGGFAGVGTTTVTCTGNGGAKTGDAIVAATNPSFFTQTMHGGGLEGFAFGVLLSSVELSKTVAGGYAGDSFGLNVSNSGGNTLATANTNGGTTASTGMVPVVVDSTGSDFVLSEAATSGTIGNYTQTWVCTRNGAADPSLPAGAGGTSATVHVGIGDTVICGITNTGLTRSLQLVKHAGTPNDVNEDGLTDAGDTIQYTFTVSNNGQVPMTNIEVVDNKARHVTCPQPTLAVGASEDCSADQLYTITTSDVTVGAVDNTATATGNAVGSSETVSSPEASTHTPTTAPAAALSVVKSADPSGAAAYKPGQKITYNFTVTNSGNVTVNGIHIVESTFTGSDPLSPATCPSTTLAPGAQEVCTTTYTLTQTDVNNKSIQNTADAEGTSQGVTVKSNDSTVTIPETPAPGMTLVKSANPTTVTSAGQTVTYSFVVTNTGNVTLNTVKVTDTDFSGTGSLSAINCPSTSLVAGQVETCTATYQATQADVDAGSITNTAQVTANQPDDTPVPMVPSNPVTVQIPASPGLTVAKTADVTAAAVAEKITYTFTVTNTGNVTITDPQVTDTGFTGTGTLSALVCPPGPITLAPAQVETCAATYTVTQADVDAGSISNAAHVTGTAPQGANPPTNDSPPVVVPTNPHPALSLVKTASSQQATTVGQVIAYTFAVTNTGNVDISNPTVKEGTFTGHGTLFAVTCPSGKTLAPGQEIDCTATYTVVAADLASAGTLSNTATVTGTTTGGDPVTSDPSTSKVTEVASVTPAGVLASTGSDTWAGGLVGLGLVILGLLAAATVWVQRRGLS